MGGGRWSKQVELAKKCSTQGLTPEWCLGDPANLLVEKYVNVIQTKDTAHTEATETKNLAYLSFRCMTFVQRGAAGKGMLA